MNTVNREKILKNCRRWVVKIGSALLTDNGKGINSQAIATWVAQMVALRKQGIEIILVSSGSVAQGIVQLGWKERPDSLHLLQAAAAVGQMGLIHTYQEAFQAFEVQTAQILLTHDDLSHRKRYLNARQTLRSLVELGVVPIINENDTVATDEIRFGDNDTLAGMVSNLVDADLLVILTDQQGFFNADPRKHADAQLIDCANVAEEKLDAYASSSGGAMGRGGMATKLRAARLAARSGAHTVIAGGSMDDVLNRISKAEQVGSLLIAEKSQVNARKQWLAAQQQIQGVLQVDQGAAKVLSNGGKSLLPVGVTSVSGDFVRGDLVACHNEQDQEIARGLVNYNAQEAAQIIGKPSEQLAEILGYQGDPELIHRDNLVLV